jgi:hypothetical protein
MRLIGYGEDALTYVALTARLGEVLRQLGDASSPSDATVLFRPSFGRRATTKLGQRASSFGEFDAILGTPRAVYLCESKWSRSGEVGKPELSLRREQIRRHSIFSWYRRTWQGTDFRASLRGHIRPGADPSLSRQVWDRFRASHVEEFETLFTNVTIPHPWTNLAENLMFTLDTLSDCGGLTEDVLLYIDIDRKECPPLNAEAPFRLVCVFVDGVDRSGFFTMPAPVPLVEIST